METDEDHATMRESFLLVQNIPCTDEIFDSTIERRCCIGINQILKVKVVEYLKSVKIKGYRWEGNRLS